MAKNYYELLGLTKGASADDIKSAYRKLAKKYHPDLYTTATAEEKKKAEEQFKEINHAYEVLSDEQKRTAYDTYGDENGPQMGAGGGAGGFGFDMEDIFSTIFNGFGGGGANNRTQQNTNGPRKGQDILVGLTISFEEAAFGTQKSVSVKRVEACPVCKGTGAKDGRAFKVCATCKGSGKVATTQRTPFGQVSTQTVCPTCKGAGRIITEKCPICGAKGSSEKVREVKVNIPSGIDSGQRITYKGEGHSGANGGEKGSLIVEVTVAPHKLFVRNGFDIQLDVPVSFIDAALGCSITVPTLYGKHDMKVPEGTQSGTVFKIKNMGIKNLRGTEKGDLYVKIIVEVPKAITREQRDMLKDLDNSFDIKQYPIKKSYLEKQVTVADSKK